MMKRLVALITIGMLIISCSQKGEENLTLIISEQTPEYALKVYTIDTKIDANGNAQCRNYLRSTINDSAYYYYGNSLHKQLSAVLNTKPKYLSNLPFDSLDKQYLKVEILNIAAEKPAYDSILRNALLKHYHLTLSTESKTVDGYSLLVEDESKLNEHLATKDSRGTIRINFGNFESESCTLQAFVNVYDYSSKDYLINTVENDELYHLEVPFTTDIPELNEALKEYGLHFKPNSFQANFYTLHPKTFSNLE